MIRPPAIAGDGDRERGGLQPREEEHGDRVLITVPLYDRGARITCDCGELQCQQGRAGPGLDDRLRPYFFIASYPRDFSRRLSWEARKSQPSAAVMRRLRCRSSRSASASFSSANVRHSADVRNMRPPITLQGAVCSRRHEGESVQNRTVRALDSRRPNLRRSGTAR